MFPFLKAKRPHRRAGDAFRSDKQWTQAAEAYRLHLRDHDGDGAIWVQLGHALKEQGDLDGAEAAYGQAIAVGPADPDPLLHLGHLLKDRGRSDHAMRVFGQLFELAPELVAEEELEALGRRQFREPFTLARDDAQAFVVEDFLSSFEQHGTMSGIQRVQAGIMLTLLDEPDLDVHFVVTNRRDGDRTDHLRLSPERLRNMLDHASAAASSAEKLRRMAIAARMAAEPILFGVGTVVVVLGSFWGFGERPARYLSAKEAGARLILFVHDVIPITHPQYCDGHLVNAFWRALAEFAHLVDGYLVNSDHTGRELGRLLQAMGAPVAPRRTVPLAHAISDALKPTHGAWPEALSAVKGRRYVVFVSTLEGRKNHLYVVQAWQRLLDAGVNVPDLVFVGRFGWRNAELADLLAVTDNLNGRVHIVHGLSDAALQAVYAGALFTTFTSFTEGWGLPVGESLVNGIPCVSSSAASMPEVGGEYADYVDPTDLEDGVAVYRRLIEDDGYRARRREQIRRGFRPRRWQDVGRDLRIELAALDTGFGPSGPKPVSMSPVMLFRPGGIMAQLSPESDYFRHPVGLALAHSFHPADPGGAWLRKRSGLFRIAVPLPPGDRVVFYMAVRPAGRLVHQPFTVAVPGIGRGQPRAVQLVAGENLLKIEGTVAPDGSCTLAFLCGNLPSDDAPQPHGSTVALTAIGYCAITDVAGRRRLRELFLLTR